MTRKGNDLLATAGDDWDRVQNAIVKEFGKSNYQGFIEQLYRLAECAEALEG